MPNPIEVGRFTQKDFDELGLTNEEIKQTYQPSQGGVFHVRGAETVGKTLWIACFYRYLIDSGFFTPYDATGNLTFKGKYGNGFIVRKGEALREYLWNLTHVPYKHKIVIISEIDSEFPARSFSSREQTEIATRMWHIAKLDNYILYDSHISTDNNRGSTDVIFHLASHYDVFPLGVDWNNQSIDFILEDKLNNTTDLWSVSDVLRSMLIYNRQELTENTLEDSLRSRPTKKQPKKNLAQILREPDSFSAIDEALEL